ncbi:MAG: TIGR04255 family protein, partial [Cellulomonadaceae bacterium]|nr:TIGR04255 family protein [Cellulomonadaceae bacterium]
MTDRVRFRPFTGDADTRISLANAPLELVLCQVRWPELQVLQGDIDEQARAFGSQLVGLPLYEKTREMGFMITPEGIQQVDGGSVHTWRSLDCVWNVTLSPRHVSVYCTRYPGFEEFITRLENAVESVATHLNVPVVDRVGMRYVNRVANQEFITDLEKYVKSAALGFAGFTSESGAARPVNVINQARFETENLVLQVRSGVLS